MDAPTAQETPVVDPPRHLFFGVEDRRLGGRAGLEEKYLQMEKSRRQKLAENVISTSMQLANAVRTMRTFDRTGNADQVIDHIDATLTDLVKLTRNLTGEVESSVDRYSHGLGDLAARDTAEVAAAMNGCTHPTHLVCDDCEPAHIEAHAAAIPTRAPAAATPTPQALAVTSPKPGPPLARMKW